MERRFMVTGYGTSKKTGALYSRASRIVEDEKKHLFGFLDSKDQYFTNDIRPLGTILSVEMAEK